MLFNADLCSTTDSPTTNVAIIYTEVDNTTAATPANIGIKVDVSPAVRVDLVIYKIAVTMMLATLKM